MADVDCTSTLKKQDKVENSDIPPPCLPSKLPEKAEKESEGVDEKPPMKEKKETVRESDCASTENKQEEVENSNMPPPCLLSKPPEKAKQESEGLTGKPPTKDKKEIVPELPYKVPSWSGIPDDLYSLEVLKNGCIISNIDLTSKPFHVFGRLPNCDVSLEHPSVSRYHAVIQYKTSDSSNSEKGFYIYDLGSTHGTTVNKSRLESKRYYRVRVGYVFKFGGSSRLFILQGPENPEEPDSDQAPTEQAAPRSSEVGRVMTEEEYEEWKKEKEGGKQDKQDTGIDWGMGEDAVEEPAYPPEFGDADKEHEEHHFKDPKKTLRGFFEREGLELEYDVEEKGPGHARVYHCKVKLPIDGPNGEPLYAEAAVTGRKKEAVLECALEACKMLDAAGLLRQSSHESKKHKEKNWEENDFYDSDEDSFLDRTGSVEKKRIQRMKRAGKEKPTMETYESLALKLKALDSEICDHENKLQQDVAGKSGSHSEATDSLDDYMSSIGTSVDKTTRSQIRRKVFELKKERQRLVKLMNIAKPASLPPVAEPPSTESVIKNDEVAMDTECEGKSSDSASVTTVDNNTDTRHESAALPEEVKMDKSSSKESSAPAEVSEKKTTDLPARKQEFAVPVPPSLSRRKNRTPRKLLVVEKSSEDEETDGSETTDNSVQPDDENKQQVRKRVGSNSSADVQQELNYEKTEENNMGSPKKKKKRSYGVPSQWEDVSDPTYAAWMPPEGQTGDGKTHLNEKFGY